MMPVFAMNSPVAPAPVGMLWLLVLLLGASVWVFVWQVRRWTTHRGWRALLDWSRERGFRLSRPDSPSGEPLDRVAGGRTRITTCLEKTPTQILQIQIHTSQEEDRSRPHGTDRRWHALVRRIQTAWPTTGLRPSGAASSLLDEFALSGYPRMGDGERFTILGVDSRAARALSRSTTGALLPRDIGLLLHGQYLILDFSTRPFDGIELGRMVALADQLERQLPVG